MNLKPLLVENNSKILFVVADGLGGLARDGGGTELEDAATPNMDRLASQGVTGLLTPVAPGITPGSGPGHLALFGYDPLEHNIGRGVLAALGIGFDLQPEDVAARGNFCTVGDNGKVTDRRAGRISSKEGRRLAHKLAGIGVHDVEIFVEPVKEHRFLLVLRGKGLDANLEDTDPQQTGVLPGQARCKSSSHRTCEVVAEFVQQARQRLADEHSANMVLLRGFARLPQLPSMQERYGLRACAIAGYPMYRGVARLLGMQAVECGPELSSEIDALETAWQRYSFFFLHFKATDHAAEDGDFDAKVRTIEELDRQLPRMLALQPDVVILTGDHSTPSRLKAHSWHPVPVLLSASSCRRDDVDRFDETRCAHGGLSQILAKDLMQVVLAHAGRLRKYGP